MEPKKPAPVTDAHVDISDVLKSLIGDTGTIQHALGGFKIKIFHTRGFPWDEVFKALLYRDYRVYVTRHKADLFIEASI